MMRGGVNEVRRVGDTVVRPAGLHTQSVHRLLRHLRSEGFVGCPEVHRNDREAGVEVLGYLRGETTGYPLKPEFRTDRALVSAGKLLRALHAASSSFALLPSDQWFLPARQPSEVVCHGDFAPYNCVLLDGEVTGVFDFDTAHPGPRLWDVGYAAYRWVTLTPPDNPDGVGTLEEQRRRLKLFCDVYGTDDINAVISAAVDRLAALVETMRALARTGNEAFAEHMRRGDDRRYLDDISYLEANASLLAGSENRPEH